MSAHTPGPWRVERHDLDFCKQHQVGESYAPRLEIRAESRMVADLSILPVKGYGFTEQDNEQQEANALLIAAAPELLVAVETAYDAIAKCGLGGSNARLEKRLEGQLRRLLDGLRAKAVAR